MCWFRRHRFVREGDEPYIKCECGRTIDFEQLDDGLLPPDALGDPPSEVHDSQGRVLPEGPRMFSKATWHRGR